MKNLVNIRFFALKVFSFSHRKDRSYYWNCLCDCGKQIIVDTSGLTSGRRKSCGCKRRLSNNKNLAGIKYGKLLVTNRCRSNGRNVFWVCKCDCGNEVEVRSTYLTTGHTKSCGCLHHQKASNNKSYKEITGTYWWYIKKHAKDRNLELSISIQDAWCQFEKQNRKCALTGMILIHTNRYKKIIGNASLDRIDSSKGYTIDNIQWVHKDINLMKMHFSKKEFIKYCQQVTDYCKTNDI